MTSSVRPFRPSVDRIEEEPDEVRMNAEIMASLREKVLRLATEHTDQNSAICRVSDLVNTRGLTSNERVALYSAAGMTLLGRGFKIDAKCCFRRALKIH